MKIETMNKSTQGVRYAEIDRETTETCIRVVLDMDGGSRRDLSTECIKEFFGSFAIKAGITLHIRKIAGENDHHLAEAMFKGVGLALQQATRNVERRGPSSTKGQIEG